MKTLNSVSNKDIKDGKYTIPNSVTSIGDLAFSGCTGLTAITIPNSLTHIGNWALYGCTGLTAITVPDSVTHIGNSALYGCTGLTAITVPDSVTHIGNSALYGCTGLTAITIKKRKTEETYKTLCADGYLIVVDGHKNFNADIEVYKGRLFLGIENKKLKLEPCFLVSKGAQSAHGETLKEAMQDLNFKMAADRGAEQYKNLSKSSILTLEEAATAYRIITGACKFGTEQFINSQSKIQEKYTVAEMMKVTKGNFGNETFCRFVKNL